MVYVLMDWRCLLCQTGDVESIKLEVVGCTLCHAAVQLDSLTQVGCQHLLVVGASAQNCHQIICGSIGLVNTGKSTLSLGVVLGKDLSESGVVVLESPKARTAEALSPCFR